MKIGLITTLNTNIGDDFIREGICRILHLVYPSQDISFVAVNKHQPLSVYPVWHPVHWAELVHRLPRHYRLEQIIGRLAPRLGMSHFDGCDLIVQCGAPVVWPACHLAEWAQPLWYDVIGRLYRRIPVLNLAAGSCYPWEKQPATITDMRDAEYLHTILGYCRLTTVRDRLARQLCGSLGVDTPLIPCSALLAAGGLASQWDSHAPILINYMPGGGHYGWEQDIDLTKWESTVRDVISRLSPRHKIAFLCHNKKEYEAAQQLDPTLPRIWPKTVREYFQLAMHAKGAICNRMHASVGLASLGIPSIAVCTDTRLLMVDAIGLPIYYVKEVSAQQLEQVLEDLVTEHHLWQEKLLTLREETKEEYVNALSEALGLG